MSYEIPQKLQYEEKIIFGLTFKQIVYALFLILPALIIFLKSSLNFYAKLVIAVLLVGTAFLFMFCDFSSYIKNMLSWFKFREMSLMDSKMINFMGIEKIEEGVLYVRKYKKSVEKKGNKKHSIKKNSNTSDRADKLHNKKQDRKAKHN
ncbi:PrgI family protein [Candidatus Woesearchaeota archaeon]|nr:PrgI family protein [Candidatus Woesearchaeota archaeon]